MATPHRCARALGAQQIHVGMQVRVSVHAPRRMRESVNTTNMMCMHAWAYMRWHTHRHAPVECVHVTQKEQTKDINARAWAPF